MQTEFTPRLPSTRPVPLRPSDHREAILPRALAFVLALTLALALYPPPFPTARRPPFSPPPSDLLPPPCPGLFAPRKSFRSRLSPDGVPR